MLRAHNVDDVRRAEASAMADLPDGALMQRAAAGLAAALVDLLAFSVVDEYRAPDAARISAVHAALQEADGHARAALARLATPRPVG